MKTFSELKTAVQNAANPESAAGTFVDGISSLIQENKNDPSALSTLSGDIRSGRSHLVNSLTGGNK